MKRGKFKRTPEIIQKHRDSMLKRYAEPKARRELSEIMERYYQNHPHPRKGKKHSLETREKIRQAHLQFNKNLREKGKPHPLKGFKHSEKTKRNMRLSKKGIFVGAKNPAWKGGRKRSGGYIFIWSPYHPYANTVGYVKENRLIVEKFIGRFLTPSEHCHHINKIKDDNRPQNLMAFSSNSAHGRFENGSPVEPKEIIFDGRNI